MSEKYLKLTDLNAYCLSYDLSNYVWKIAFNWNIFAKDVVGKQYVRSVDSISANIAEGFGRYNAKDRIRFYRISLGSVFESIDWTRKSFERNLIDEKEYNHIINHLKVLPKEINHLIKFTIDRLKH